MNAPNVPQEAPPAFVFSSPEGFALCRLIPEEHLPYAPYDFQIEGICKAFDRVNLLAILATGTGKTGFLTTYMIIVLAIKKNPSLCPSAKFPGNPCMLVIMSGPVLCPCKELLLNT